MINNSKIIKFFDSLAPEWDNNMITDDEIINNILMSSAICSGKTVLDVACGTGVLIPYYLKYSPAQITGVDISQHMTEIASSKYLDCHVSFICSDIYDLPEDIKYDCIFLYNALPHFASFRALIEKLCRLSSTGGRIVIAHGMSREKINEHHSGSASMVSQVLPEASEIASLFPETFGITNIVDSSSYYLVSVINNQEV